MPREHGLRGSQNWLPRTNYWLIAVELVDEFRVIQQRVEATYLVVATIGEERYDHRMSRRHYGIHHEALARRNILGHIGMANFEKAQLLRTSGDEGSVIGECHDPKFLL